MTATTPQARRSGAAKDEAVRDETAKEEAASDEAARGGAERDGAGGAERNGAARAERFSRGVAVAAGVVFLLPGLWAFFAPASFYEMAATFEPYNVHFVRDIGAFQIGLGLVLVLAAVVRDALLVALVGVGTAAGFHLASHVIDRGHGGDPAVDLPVFGLVAVVLLGAAAARASHLRRGGETLRRRPGETGAGS